MERDLDPAGASARARDPQHAAARRLLPDSGGSSRLSQFAELATKILGVAHVNISVLTEVQTVVGVAGLPPSWLGSETALSDSLCSMCAKGGRPLVINDARADARVAGLTVVRDGRAGSFCSVPLTTDAGEAVGAVCAWDAESHIWSQADVANLQSIARAVLGELELGALTREFDLTRQRWNLAIEAAGIGSWDWNLRTGQLVWDQRLVEIFGYDGDEHFDESIEAFNARVHPDDVPGVTQALEHAISTVGVYEAEYRIVLPDGRIRQVQARGRAMGDANGRAVRIAGGAWDVSTTRGGQRVASDVLETMPVGHVSVAADWTITSVNGAAELLLACRRWEVVGHDVWRVLPAVRDEALAAGLRAVAVDRLARTVEVRLPAPADRWVEIRVFPAEDGVTLYVSDDDDRHTAQQLAAEAAEHDRQVAVALQDAMLTRLPEPDHLEIRARYLTAAERDQVGGDWYDAVIQSDGATTLTVGDVCGHDIGAAAYMGQLRSMLRALAWNNPGSPAASLAALDHAMRDLRLTTLATCVTARVEQSAEQRARGVHTLRWSNAGNMPPVVVTREGAATLLERAPELLLGVDPGCTRHDHTAEIPPGATLLLFTDGLVEIRDMDLSSRLDAVVDVAARHVTEPLAQMIDAVLAAMVGAQGEDDVVVLGVRMHVQEEPRPPEAGPRTD